MGFYPLTIYAWNIGRCEPDYASIKKIESYLREYSVTVSRKRKARSSATKEQLRCLCYFEVRLRTGKYAVPYFFFESEAVEDLNVQVIRSYSWAAAESPKKLVV
jgi:hypothetical protein